MAKEQRLVLVEASKSEGFIPITGFGGKMENIFAQGWEIAQLCPVSQESSSYHKVVLLLERDAEPARQD